MIDAELAKRIVDLMNDALRRDPVAVSRLISARVRCNDALADHPTIQVIMPKSGGTVAEPTVGLLGILNGICGISKTGWGPVVADVDEMPDGDIVNFFRLTDPKLLGE